jgi:hypothetical protein
MKNQTQLQMAQDFLNAIQTEFEHVTELSALDILDNLAYCGLSLNVGEDASKAYISTLSAIASKVK